MLDVHDDGSGFDVATAGGDGGLRGMRERALLVGGQLQVASRAGEGTRIRLSVPVPRSGAIAAHGGMDVTAATASSSRAREPSSRA